MNVVLLPVEDIVKLILPPSSSQKKVAEDAWYMYELRLLEVIVGQAGNPGEKVT